MLDTCTIEERWTGVSQLIERWLQERQELIVQYCAVSGIHGIGQNEPLSNDRLTNLCQILVDYVSAGHFEVYYQLILEAEAFGDGSEEAAQELLPRITATTGIAMEFHDAYIEANDENPKLSQHLSKLGEVLEARFSLEDQLIDSLHESHRTAVA